MSSQNILWNRQTRSNFSPIARFPCLKSNLFLLLSQQFFLVSFTFSFCVSVYSFSISLFFSLSLSLSLTFVCLSFSLTQSSSTSTHTRTHPHIPGTYTPSHSEHTHTCHSTHATAHMPQHTRAPTHQLQVKKLQKSEMHQLPKNHGRHFLTFLGKK